MLSFKAERIVFAVIFVLCLFWVGSYATGLKYNELAINKELTPEQVIEQKYPKISDKNLRYKYEIIDDFMFVCVETLKGRCHLDYAFCNENSGYMFDIPGLKFWSHQELKSGIIELPNGGFFYHLFKVKSKYIIEIIDLSKLDIDIFCNSIELSPLTFEGSSDQYWVTVTDNLEEIDELYCIYQDEKIHILNGYELKALLGEE